MQAVNQEVLVVAVELVVREVMRPVLLHQEQVESV